MRKINFLWIPFIASVIVSSCLEGNFEIPYAGTPPLPPTGTSNQVTYEEAEKEVVDLLDFLDVATRSNIG